MNRLGFKGVLCFSVVVRLGSFVVITLQSDRSLVAGSKVLQGNTSVNRDLLPNSTYGPLHSHQIHHSRHAQSCPIYVSRGAHIG